MGGAVVVRIIDHPASMWTPPEVVVEGVAEVLEINGGRDRTRTCDLLRVNWPGGLRGGERR